MLRNKRILLIVSGGIAAFKALELVRRLKEREVTVWAILTQAGAKFITPMSLQALTGNKVYEDLFSLTEESEMGHIELSRKADLIVIAPATADILSKMTSGLANDLASTVLLATNKPVLIVPAMNVRMWEHPATQNNIAILRSRGVRLVGPNSGDMACGEYGPGRMSEPMEIVESIEKVIGDGGPLTGRSAIVTSGPTWESIDPVRYIANRSSGKQGHAIASALSLLGATTKLVTGPTFLPDPVGVQTVHIESASEMLDACNASIPVDIAVCAAAVADWRVENSSREKIKKRADNIPPIIELKENPDILETLSNLEMSRPTLVIGFAAETETVVSNGILKREKKGCDWIVANDVRPEVGTFGSDENTVHLLTDKGSEDWPRMTKEGVAVRLAERIAAHFAK